MKPLIPFHKTKIFFFGVVAGLTFYWVYTQFLTGDELTATGIGWVFFPPQFTAFWALGQLNLSDRNSIVLCYAMIGVFYGFITLAIQMFPKRSIGAFLIGAIGYFGFIQLNDLPQWLERVLDCCFWPALTIHDVLIDGNVGPRALRVVIDCLTQGTWCACLISSVHAICVLGKRLIGKSKTPQQPVNPPAAMHLLGIQTSSLELSEVDSSKLQKVFQMGWYVGVCTNKTAGLSANLLLAIFSANNSILQGELWLAGDLTGDGPFNAAINSDKSFVFTTRVQSPRTSIEWDCQISGQQLTGNYSATCDDVNIAPELQHQSGVYWCRFVQSITNSNPLSCDTFWIYHDGKSEGPFPTKNLSELILNKSWPLAAYVAFKDRTHWSTIAKCLEELNAAG